ncbi:hypothetical protein [Hymenobacter properus]|uniref:Uncharacterized protein n=1 Tax=Hymenobacter properus TaxID=2791026 RepID=A0A931FLP2_9BACT|nr:hypothetical protein [Hymenobacter properus]MBF9142231.1 hypothetical protein [Hymenobacter properus]MBR7721038.1 hypothetical protein [Microvirga sp. SRT04]
MIKFLYCLFCLGLLSGCAAFGTKTRFADAGTLPAITRVALVTTKVDMPPGFAGQEADSLFVKALAKELQATTGWQVQYLGDVNTFMANMDNANNAALNGDKFQAVVHAELMLKFYGMIGNTPRFNSWTRMQIINLPNKTLLGESHFNTLMGNSYMAHPILPVAVADGVTGMVRPWQKRLSQQRTK